MTDSALEQSLTRECGKCMLCCRLLPVADIRKPRGRWCEHARPGRGCAVHADRPESCRVWSCGWKVDLNLPYALRPDACHVVLDPVPTSFLVRDDATGAETEVTAIQVWSDPKHPGAWRRDPINALIRANAVQRNLPVVIRIGFDVVTLFPPGICSDRRWHEHSARATDWRGKYDDADVPVDWESDALHDAEGGKTT